MQQKKTRARAKKANTPNVKSTPKGAKTASINVRVTPATKARAEAVFAKLGFGMSDGISMFLQQVIHHKGIPFELRVPNKETRAAMRDAELGRNLTSYSSIEEMMKDLNA